VAADGNSLFYTDGSEEFWRKGFDGRPAVQIPGLEHCRFGRLWFLSDRGIYYVNIDANRFKLLLYDFRSRMSHPVLTCHAIRSWAIRVSLIPQKTIRFYSPPRKILAAIWS
jgi:hypothetical protein